MNTNDAVLVIEDKKNKKLLTFEGTHFGYAQSAEEIGNQFKKIAEVERGFGEVVFNTAMSGYEEILTDPSYFGQLICMTYPHIGNTGINLEDQESDQPWCSGFIVSEACEEPSNYRSKESLASYLKRMEIPGIQNVDTRQLTIQVRSQGALRGLILKKSDAEKAQSLFDEMPELEGRDFIARVTCKNQKSYLPENQKPKFRIVAMDFGIKTNLLRILKNYDCEVIRVPASTSHTEILNLSPDGVFLSNGPGDPAAAPYAVDTIRSLLGEVPIFGVCMGHQLLSLSIGAETFKLKFGHHGANQPVIEHETGRVQITSQNHGFAVKSNSLESKNAFVTHTHLNDKTIAGISIPDRKAYSVQFHPEASPGPHDSMVIFDQFMNWIKESKKHV